MVEFKFVGISILSIKLLLILWVYLRVKNLKYCFSKKEKKKKLKYSISYNKYGNKDDNALVTLKI